MAQQETSDQDPTARAKAMTRPNAAPSDLDLTDAEKGGGGELTAAWKKNGEIAAANQRATRGALGSIGWITAKIQRPK